MNEMADETLASLGIPVASETDIASPWSGTRALMLAVLEDAIHNLTSCAWGRRAEAEGWVMSRERQYVFSFAVICETLNLDASAVRRAVMRANAHRASGRPVSRRARPNVRHKAMEQIDELRHAA